MRKIKLRFNATIHVDEWKYNNNVRESQTKIKIYDSNCNYLTYMETSTISELARYAGTTEQEWLDSYYNDLSLSGNIWDLLSKLGIDSYFCVDRASDFAVESLVEELTSSDAYSQEDVDYWLGESLDHVLENFSDMINIIGDYIVLCWDEIW